MTVLIAGNLCRCTGYRPIVDGYRTFCEVNSSRPGSSLIWFVSAAESCGTHLAWHFRSFMDLFQAAQPFPFQTVSNILHLFQNQPLWLHIFWYSVFHFCYLFISFLTMWSMLDISRILGITMWLLQCDSQLNLFMYIYISLSDICVLQKFFFSTFFFSFHFFCL